jgi:hypothetical protein
MVEDSVICWRCGYVGLLTENLMSEPLLTYSETRAVGKGGSGDDG